MSEIEALRQALQDGSEIGLLALMQEHPDLIEAELDGLPLTLRLLYHGLIGPAQYAAERKAHLNVFEAAAFGKTEQLNALLSEQPELRDVFSADGFQPLGLAAFFDQPQALEVLLDSGAEVNTPSRNGLAVTPLGSAAAGGRFACAQLLLQRGADPNLSESGGYTPLHAAAQNGDIELAALLLGQGADPAARSAAGETPADLARQHGFDDVAELLARHGGD